MLLQLSIFLLVSFFFQAEDGIRDFHVTGVQTCALPILCAAGACVLLLAIGLPVLLTAAYQEAFTARVVDLRHWLLPLASLLLALCGYRSEERRVGKECRSRWWLSMSTNRHECIQLRAET